MKTLKKLLTIGALTLASILPAKDIYVEKTGGDYSEIQEAVYFAQPNDKIIVGEGVFRENVELKKDCPLDIIGQGVDKTTVKGFDRNSRGTATFMMDGATSINLENMLITNSYYGIRIENSSRISIKNNLVIGNGDTNLQLLWSSNCSIDGNTFDGDSLFGNTDYGLYYIGGKNKIINNIVVNQQRQGIYSPQDGNEVLISFNNVWNNLMGNIDIRNSTTTLVSNISKDPLFRNRLSADYELINNPSSTQTLSEAEYQVSPCIDSGTKDGINPDNITDMGAWNIYGNVEREPTRTSARWWQGYE